MKSLAAVFLVLTVVAITECSVQLPDELTFSKSDLEFLKNIKLEQLPADLKITLLQSVRTGKSSNWCCSNNVPIDSVQKSKVITNTVQAKTTVKVGYQKCGSWGKKCAIYDIRTSNQVVYHVQYYEVPETTKCDEKDISCCEHHVNVAGNCVLLSDAQQYQKTLLALQGLLGKPVG